MLLYYNLILVVQYLFIFWIKNPAAINEDFWTTLFVAFVQISSVVFTFIIYFVPIRKPFNYYLCSGYDPTPDLGLSERPHGSFELVSLALHIAVKLRILVFKRAEKTTYCLAVKIEEESLGSISISIANLLIFLALAMLRSKMNGLSLNEVLQLSNGHMLLISQLILPNLFAFAMIILYFINHKPIRQKVAQIVLNFFSQTID